MNIGGENSVLRQIVDYLHSEALNSYNIELPQIAVLGDTSSGKSSLLSAIANIQFPSNASLTTRCPTRLHMQRSLNGVSSAQVGVHWSDPNATYASAVFELITCASFDEIPQAISKAQEFIMAKSAKQVAPDIVEVKVQSPDCIDLTLINLPGLVRTIGKGEDPQIIQDINSIIQSFLKNPRCVLMTIIPANVDFHNNQVIGEAKKVDPNTERTIPVITKPDLIDVGGENDILQLLLGELTHDFQLGFHMVKCRGQQALTEGKTIEQGLASEAAFFRITAPWRKVLQNPEKASLFGVPELGKKLELLQIEVLKRTVPDIINDICSQLTEGENDLKAIGQDLSNDGTKLQVFLDIMRKLNDYLVANFASLPTGKRKTGDEYSLQAALLKLFDDYRNKVHNTKLAQLETIREGDLVFVTKGEIAFPGKAVKVKIEMLDNNEKRTYMVVPSDQKLLTYSTVINTSNNSIPASGRKLGDITISNNKIYLVTSPAYA